ncbi:hypothetical protein E2C01_006215 [Portunus trituberculatus]|uniref:Secreted protein n=1 Tax=Portunus trituberculatus TaxID=210409 RepID=A0A5B7CWA6_PORTR|nr:hypothetical protein [Portunus trituberculatus]
MHEAVAGCGWLAVWLAGGTTALKNSVREERARTSVEGREKTQFLIRVTHSLHKRYMEASYRAAYHPHVSGCLLLPCWFSPRSVPPKSAQLFPSQIPRRCLVSS